MNTKIAAHFDLTIADVQLLEEALVRARSRLDSLGRADPKNAKRFDDKAAAMEKLRQRLRSELEMYPPAGKERP